MVGRFWEEEQVDVDVWHNGQVLLQEASKHTQNVLFQLYASQVFHENGQDLDVFMKPVKNN